MCTNVCSNLCFQFFAIYTKKWNCEINGTYVNSEKVTEEGHKIVPGDIISIGDIKLRVEAY